MLFMMSSEDEQLRRATLALNGKAWGAAFGILCGTGLFLATIVLVIKGGPNMGQHLNLISVYLPGYSVSVLGAFVGFIYLFVIGYALGRLIGMVYNAIALGRT